MGVNGADAVAQTKPIFPARAVTPFARVRILPVSRGGDGPVSLGVHEIKEPDEAGTSPEGMMKRGSGLTDEGLRLGKSADAVDPAPYTLCLVVRVRPREVGDRRDVFWGNRVCV